MYVWFEVEAEVVIGLIIRQVRLCVCVLPQTPLTPTLLPKTPFSPHSSSLPHSTLTPMKAEGHGD